MKNRYWTFQRGNGVYYLQDRVTGRQTSLRTKDKVKAQRLATARNQAVEQPALNVAMARAYLSGKSPQLATRTWESVMTAVAKCGGEATQQRCVRAMQSAPFKLLRKVPLVETDSQMFLDVLNHERAGTSTNNWLRRLHNYALDLGWLLAPVMARKAWPVMRYKIALAITAEEHQQITQTESSEERRLYYEMLWETGGSQSDVASLTWDAVDPKDGILTYWRCKRGPESAPAHIKIGPRLQAILDRLPQSGPFFPTLRHIEAKHRAAEFRRRCGILGIKKKTLKSYRNAWTERARNAGMPIREAMEWVGHTSQAVHRAYAKNARVVCMPLEYYEAERDRKIVQFQTPPPATISQVEGDAVTKNAS
jgi:integrase